MSIGLELDVCSHVYGWRHLVKAMKITAGLAESNDSLSPGGWLKVTFGLTACIPGSAPGQTLGNEYQRTLPFYLRMAIENVHAQYDKIQNAITRHNVTVKILNKHFTALMQTCASQHPQMRITVFGWTMFYGPHTTAECHLAHLD